MMCAFRYRVLISSNNFHLFSVFSKLMVDPNQDENKPVNWIFGSRQIPYDEGVQRRKDMWLKFWRKDGENEEAEEQLAKENLLEKLQKLKITDLPRDSAKDK